MPLHEPLLAHRNADTAFAFDRGSIITAGQYLADVTALAARLPAAPLLNLCIDRYRFAVALGAALIAGRTVLLPPDRTPVTLDALRGDGALALLTDEAERHDGPDTIIAVTTGCDPASGFAIPRIAADHPAVVLFTSGTTGTPVGTGKTWGSLCRSARAEARALGLADQPRLSILGTVPAQHSYGLESTVLLALQMGFAFDASKPLFPADVRDALARLPRPRLLVTTPVHLRALCEDPVAPPPADLVLSATAPLDTALALRAETQFDAPLAEIYGCSEAGQIAARRTTENPAWRPMVDLRMTQDHEGTWIEGGHVPGRVLLADVIDLRADGTFLLQGRAADLVNIAGKRSSLSHLNHHLNAVPGVTDGVFVIPDDGHAGTVTRLAAIAVAPGVAADAILAALRERLDPVFLPRPLRLVDRLPRNPTGKLQRRQLLALLAGDEEPRR